MILVLCSVLGEHTWSAGPSTKEAWTYQKESSEVPCRSCRGWSTFPGGRAEGAGPAQPREEPEGDLINTHKHLRGGRSQTLKWRQVPGAEAAGAKRSAGGSLWTSGTASVWVTEHRLPRACGVSSRESSQSGLSSERPCLSRTGADGPEGPAHLRRPVLLSCPDVIPSRFGLA